MNYVKFEMSMISVDNIFNIIKEFFPAQHGIKDKHSLTVTYNDGRRMGVEFHTREASDEAFDKITKVLGAK